MILNAAIPVVEIWDLTPTPIDMLVGFSHEKVGQAVADYLLKKVIAVLVCYGQPIAGQASVNKGCAMR